MLFLSSLWLQACFKEQTCTPCSDIIQAYADDSLHFVGGISLFFSFTEVSKHWRPLLLNTRKMKHGKLNEAINCLVYFNFGACFLFFALVEKFNIIFVKFMLFSLRFQILGVWLAHRYRNLKDHRQNPGAFI